MSTESQSVATSRRFPRTVLAVIAVLAVLCGAGAAASLVQGPRVSSVSSDPQTAIASSGSRVVITSNQALEEIDPAQISVSPEAEHTVDASGRTVGVRFSGPLDEGTTYTITISDVRGVGGGATSDLTATVQTPTAPVYLLRRSVGGEDVIYRTTLGTDEQTVVFSHDQIEDFRRTPDGLVISVVEGERARLLLTDVDGTETAEVRLPGPGFVTGLQVSDRGALVGFQFSDIGISEGAGRESQLLISDLRSPDDEPVALAVAGETVSVDHWRFVPDSSALLALPFGGEMVLADPASNDAPVPLGNVRLIETITRGSYTAIVDRPDKRVRVDLQAGTDSELATPEIVDGTVNRVDTLAGDDLLWTITRRDAAGMPTASTLVVDTASEDRELLTQQITDPIVDVCPSPSGDRVAVTVSPDYAGDSYDLYRQPLPQNVRTRVYDVADGTQIADLAGFDMSWCSDGPFMFR